MLEPALTYYKELSILTALVAGVFAASIACLNYHYSRKLRGCQAMASAGSNQDELYRAEQTLHELQQE